ncbi:outer membrane receptor protein involved in Fe transport [Bradyrhizobium sp. LM3.2]
MPYYKKGNVPVTSAGIPRGNWYGFLNRDFQTARQDFGTGTIEYKVNEAITLSSKVRGEHSLLNYIGTLPQNPNTTSPNPLLWTTTASAQSRLQNVDVWANQNEATFKLDTGGVKHTAVFGVEYANENISIDRYAGLASELAGSAFTSTGAVTGVNLYSPQYTNIPFGIAVVDRKSDALWCQHQQRVRHGHRQLAGHDHRQWRHPLRRLQHELVDQLAELPENERRPRQLQRRPGLQADVDRQRLCGLCDFGQSVRLGA